MSDPKPRLAPPSPAGYTAAQKKAADEFAALRKEPPFGPFGLLLHSPELMTLVQKLGEYLRYRSSMGQKLSELAVLVTARECSQDYEWHLHRPIAVKSGIRPEIADAIRDGRRPDGMSEDEALVYDLSVELHRTKNVSDALYARALARFGAQGVVDLIGTNGYYALLAMQLNAHRMPLPDGAPRLPRL
jgi:4-carboxymuconolactone decarboxylase